MKVTKHGALVVGASLVLSACSQGATTAPGGGHPTKGTVNIAI
jgi:ABC-type glycerol-3-phosphate transport system substrate-binding protein